MSKILLIFIATYVLSISSGLFANDCLKTRAPFDIGSGSTKMKVAQVDICKKKIVEILANEKIAVPYKESLGPSNVFSEIIMEKGIEAINHLKNIAMAFNPEIFVATATSAFRTASNGKLAAKIISEATNIEINIISQEQEAFIGFVAASTTTEKNDSDIVVWDIGGGSMQMTSFDRNKGFFIYKGKMASVNFKEFIIEKILFKNPQEVITPNPISLHVAQVAINEAKFIAQNDPIPLDIRQKFLNPGIEVIGIGGVHAYSIKTQVNSSDDRYSFTQVQEGLQNRLDLTDEELGGEYAATDVSNLLLVLGFMDELQIDQVRTADINMTDGLLVAPALAANTF